MAERNFLPRCTAFFNRIPIESLMIRDSNAMHLGKNSSPPSEDGINSPQVIQDFVKIFYEFFRNNENATISKIIKISKIATADLGLQLITQSSF